MNMMTLSLSDTLKTFIDEQASAGAFESGGDYVRALVAKERDRQVLRRLLLEGAASPPGDVVNDAYFAALKERARQRAAG